MPPISACGIRSCVELMTSSVSPSSQQRGVPGLKPRQLRLYEYEEGQKYLVASGAHTQT